MTFEQLLATRATLWRQKAEPLLTLDDAQSWILQSGLCLFLPRKAQIPAPAPSLVEACLGETNETPQRAAIGTARNLLARLIEVGSALPLNLLGTASDNPDFVVSTEVLPFVYALRGERDWKHAPGKAGAGRVSPLVIHIWKLLERRGVLTAGEIQEELGRELTEAAVLRALHELWASLRVVPLYPADGRATLWEPLQSRHQKAIACGAGMSQVTALSVLVSAYLQSVVAASSEDAESFLSPLASRSKVREVVRGLTATRQLAMIQMETQSLLFVEGSLPEFPEALNPAPAAAEIAVKPSVRRPGPTFPAGVESRLRRSLPGSSPRPAYKRPVSAGERTPGRSPGGSAFRPAAGGRPDSRRREGSGSRPDADSAQPPFKPRFRPKLTQGERSEPGTGLRSDGTPKKTRWRDLPGGRPDQKGKPKRFGPRKAENSAAAELPVPRREPGRFRPSASAKPPLGKRSFERNPSPRHGKPFRPTSDGRPAGAGRPRPGYGGGRQEAGRPAVRSYDSRPGSRPPFRSGAARSARPERSQFFSRPRREGAVTAGTPRKNASSAGGPRFAPRPPRAGGFSASRPGAGDARPYSHSSSAGQPKGGKSFGGSSFGRRPGASSFRPTGPRTGGGSGSRPTSRPGFGQGPRPGTGRSGSGSGRPRSGAGPKPGGPPPAKFKKRPERSAPERPE